MRKQARGGGVVLALVLAFAGTLAAEEWFDAYEKGLLALRQKQAVKAAEAFERAIRQRPEPGANVLTYGTNRIERYHPYLRLAEARLLAGEPEKAREALRRSESKGREPAEERSRLAAQVEVALEKLRLAAATPPPTLPAATLPPPPSTVALAPPPSTSMAAPPAPPPMTAPTASANGTLDLRSDPDGATVLLDGRLLGRTPLRVELAAGSYPVTLRKEGTAEQSFSLRIEPGRLTSVTRPLVATSAPAAAPAVDLGVASIIVFAEPPGASAYLDDEPLGVTDLRSGRLVKSGVSPGSHRLRLSLAGHQDFAQEVEVTAGAAVTVRGSLAPSAPAATRWSPVLLAGVAVAVLVVLFVARSRQGRARGGTVVLPPKRSTGQAPTVAPSATEVPSLFDQLEEIETRAIPNLKSGERFGEYTLLEALGKGGMATVYKAERRGELCALKRPLTALLDDPEFLERFLREAEIGRTLHHPNIIRIFERGEVANIPYFTMELVRGETLQARVRRDGALGPKDSARLVVQVAEALDYAHLKGVVHRDLKPSNIMVLEDGTAKVMDYGIARARRFEGLTLTGAFLGTPDYVAPETAEGKGADARSDLYSLGIVFYELLTGKKPFVGDTPFATLRKHCTEPPTPPSVVSPNTPRELEAIILKLLRKEPDERYPGAEELLIELRDYLNQAA